MYVDVCFLDFQPFCQLDIYYLIFDLITNPRNCHELFRDFANDTVIELSNDGGSDCARVTTPFWGREMRRDYYSIRHV